MNKYTKMIPVVAVFLAFSANAEVLLKDSSEIVGKWKLHDEAIKLNGEKRPVTVEWNVKPDGTIDTITSDSKGRISEMKITIKYTIENGGITKQVAPGREKYESCQVIDKTDTEMTLHCSYYYFLTRVK